MTLSSQAPRMMGQVYTKNPRGRRRGFRWKIPFLVLVAGGLLVYVMFFRGGSETPAPGAPNQPVAAQPQQPAPGQNQGQIRPAAGSANGRTSGTLTVGANTGRSVSANNNQRSSAATNQQRTSQTVAPLPRTRAPKPRAAKTQVATSYVPSKITRVQKQTAPQVAQRINQGQSLLSQGKHVEGRKLLSQILTGAGQSLAPFDAHQIRKVLMGINNELVFSPRVQSGDPLVASYKIKPGDYYSRVAPRHKLEWRLLERINKIPANRLGVGRTIKIINGPFHAVVDKSDFRMDIFLPDTDGSWIYITSFNVGLGENNSTPEGQWIIKPRSKTVNPQWSNPRTGQFFRADDPRNPIGEYWLGLEGTDGVTSIAKSYGIHGTIDPDSIGKQKSLGCVRMGDKQIEFIYQLLVEKHSQIVTKP
jgi:lipoprotein-anchoring transpeptidase ErfK/SrfK